MNLNFSYNCKILTKKIFFLCLIWTQRISVNLIGWLNLSAKRWLDKQKIWLFFLEKKITCYFFFVKNCSKLKPRILIFWKYCKSSLFYLWWKSKKNWILFFLNFEQIRRKKMWVFFEPAKVFMKYKNDNREMSRTFPDQKKNWIDLDCFFWFQNEINRVVRFFYFSHKKI